MSKKRKWLIGLGIAFLAIVAVIGAMAAILAKRIEPYIREQAILYLTRRFDSEVALAGLHVSLPNSSPLHLVLTRGRGGIARVEGSGLLLRHKGRRDLPPMLAMKKFSFDVDLGSLFTPRKLVPAVKIDGMEINVPPKGERPNISSGRGPTKGSTTEIPSPPQETVFIQEVLISDAKLAILPRDTKKLPLQFEIYRLRLESAGLEQAMKYDARLTNPKPPGEILSQGSFGPWSAEEPGDTPLAGKYSFHNADLGVFASIGGTLHSTGSFEGTLDSINARGDASVPNFVLKQAGNPVPLLTRFEVLVDGTNGNTILKPVIARLGSTNFTTSGGVIQHERDQPRMIALDVSMPKGNLRDVLRLAMKGPPFMEGLLSLKTSIDIPPLSRTVKEKLILDGHFEVSQGKFLRTTIQDQIDKLSRRGQGQPNNREIDEVVYLMGGSFKLKDEVLDFRALSFSVPGATVDLSGNYDLQKDMLDFHGALKLNATVSQTMTGWKRWVLKPVDPFFSKEGAGTFLRIRIDGNSRQPKFGLDRNKESSPKETATNSVPR